jgi:S1-C subfamily serine protease
MARPRHQLLAIAATCFIIAGLATYNLVSETNTGRGPLTLGQIKAKVDPAVVDITTELDVWGHEAGTGMLITPTGEILTNDHVVAGANAITVTLTSSAKSYPATLLGEDASRDVALLEIANVSGLATIQTASASTATVGDTVTAIGNALGENHEPAAVQGEITAVKQTITASDEIGIETETLTGLLQTTAPTQLGDSGGATVNTAGNVIGMTTASNASRATAATVSYAIPIDDALAVANAIQSGTAPGAGRLGPHGHLASQSKTPKVPLPIHPCQHGCERARSRRILDAHAEEGLMRTRQHDAPPPDRALAGRTTHPKHQLRMAVGAAVLAITVAACGSNHNARRRTDPHATQPKSSEPTSSTTAPAGPTPRVPASEQVAADTAAISRFFAHLNSEYGISPQAGYAADVATDYFVTEGLFPPAQCTKYWLHRDGGYFMVERTPIISTISATPSWRPLLGSVPEGGRLYALTVRFREWPSAKGSSGAFTGTQTLHVLVLPKGSADLFVPCAPRKSA